MVSAIRFLERARSWGDGMVKFYGGKRTYGMGPSECRN